MEKFGQTAESIKNALEENTCNSVAATYFILRHRSTESREEHEKELREYHDRANGGLRKTNHQPQHHQHQHQHHQHQHQHHQHQQQQQQQQQQRQQQQQQQQQQGHLPLTKTQSSDMFFDYSKKGNRRRGVSEDSASIMRPNPRNIFGNPNYEVNNTTQPGVRPLYQTSSFGPDFSTRKRASITTTSSARSYSDLIVQFTAMSADGGSNNQKINRTQSHQPQSQPQPQPQPQPQSQLQTATQNQNQNTSTTSNYQYEYQYQYQNQSLNRNSSQSS
eukprot:Pgem_evm1s2031